jgi:hypothetical protein
MTEFQFLVFFGFLHLHRGSQMLMQNETACYCPENFRSMMGPIFGAEKSTVVWLWHHVILSQITFSVNFFDWLTVSSHTNGLLSLFDFNYRHRHIVHEALNIFIL